MHKVSDDGEGRNQELPPIAGSIGAGVPDVIPFDAAGETRAFSTGSQWDDPDDDDDDGDMDSDLDNTPLAPAESSLLNIDRSGVAAIGPACSRGPRVTAPPRLAYSLCAVLILKDPEDGSDYHADGQQLLGYETLHEATTAVDVFAKYPQGLPLIRVKGVSHLVVNHFTGEELYRRPIRVAA
jgi:hypothetical protein